MDLKTAKAVVTILERAEQAERVGKEAQREAKEIYDRDVASEILKKAALATATTYERLAVALREIAAGAK